MKTQIDYDLKAYWQCNIGKKKQVIFKPEY